MRPNGSLGPLSICWDSPVIPIGIQMEWPFSTGHVSEKKEYLQRYSSCLVLTGITEKLLYHLFHSTSTMSLDEIRRFCQSTLLLQIVEPGLLQKKSQLCAKGTRSSYFTLNKIVHYDNNYRIIENALFNVLRASKSSFLKLATSI